MNCVQRVVTCNSQFVSCSGYQDCVRQRRRYEALVHRALCVEDGISSRVEKQTLRCYLTYKI